MPNPESTPHPVSSNFEGQESIPNRKHKIHIESEQDGTIDARERWLERTFRVDGDKIVANDAKRDVLQNLDRYNQELPEHEQVITRMRNQKTAERFGAAPDPRPLPSLIKEAYVNGNKEELGSYQQFGKALTQTYGPQPGESWHDLSETRKRDVRTGEMTILAIDSLKTHEFIKKNPGKMTPGLEKITNILDRYSESNDIPDRFKEVFISSIVVKPEPEQSSPAQFQGKTIHDLWGKPAAAESSQPVNNEPVTITPPTKIPGFSQTPQFPSSDEVIDMNYNPQTGAYEQAPSAPDLKGIGYEPPSTPDVGSMPSPSPSSPE